MPPLQLPLRTVMVRAAVNADGLQAMVYATEGFEIPREWSSVQLSPHIALALRSGDLEERGPDDRPLSRSEVEQKYGSGPLQRRAIHRLFRPPVRHGHRTKEAPRRLLPAPVSTAQDVGAPTSPQRRKGRPKGTSAQVQAENEQVAALIAGGTKPYRAYWQVAAAIAGDDVALFEDKRVSIERNYQRFLKGPTKRPK
jgi:hypothetical protein